jgi:CRP/FNR family transcriptional regulator, cyclic AMP receptor protein
VARTCNREEPIRTGFPEALDCRTRQPHGVEPGAVAELIKRSLLVEFPCRHTIYAEGEPGDRLYIIVSGKVKLTRRSPEGLAGLLSVIGPPDVFGALSTLDAGLRTATAATITAVCAASMDRDAIRARITECPESAELLLRLLARQLRRNDADLTELISTDGPGRVARQLLALAQRFGTYEDGELRVTPGLTQEEIAQMIGSSRETVNKTLAAFAHRGWIQIDGKSVLIREPKRLAERFRY